MVKKILTILIILSGIVLLGFGYYRYHSKISGISKNTVTRQSSIPKANKNYSLVDKNLPKTIQEKLDKNKKLTLTLLVQSNSVVIDRLKAAMDSAYGSGTWNYKVITYAGSSSTDILKNKIPDQVNATQPDLILYEAPLLTDNLNIDDPVSLSNNAQILTDLSKSTPNLLVEPSTPIYQGIVYPTQEVAFKQTISTKYTYLDYWSAFPATNSAEMKNLVVDDGTYRTLNDAGNKVWSDYLINYFVSK